MYINPTADAGRDFVMRALANNITGPIVMLNLLKFREIADYSETPDLAPAAPLSGAQAFQRYIDHTLPYLKDTGGEILFLGKGGPWLIGPDVERWDFAMLIKQANVQSFISFASNEGYLGGLGHRTAAIEDSRLLPLLPTDAAT